jgi:hypothetical protein
MVLTRIEKFQLNRVWIHLSKLFHPNYHYLWWTSGFEINMWMHGTCIEAAKMKPAAVPGGLAHMSQDSHFSTSDLRSDYPNTDRWLTSEIKIFSDSAGHITISLRPRFLAWEIGIGCGLFLCRFQKVARIFGFDLLREHGSKCG